MEVGSVVWLQDNCVCLIHILCCKLIHINIIFVKYLYVNLRRSRDGTVFVPSCVCCYPRFIQFALATCYAVHINALSI